MDARNHGRGRLALIAAGLLLAAGAASADPPARVARLAYVNGAVSLAPSGSNDWTQAGLNRPLMPGDRLWVDPGGRDEVQAGSAALRMDGGTLVSVLNLDDRTTQFQLTQGRALLRVRHLDPGEVMEVDTPNLALAIRRPGVYRLEVAPDGSTTAVAVRSGQAEAYGEGNAYLIDPGQSYRFGGTNLQDYQYAQLPPDDDFERWAVARDRRRDNAVARRYVSPELTGYEDLDDNGSWRSVPNYGNVWVPAHVAPDWAPYRDGHWSWVDPWGWTWVDDAPWGFAVSHYGRWTHLDTGWGWVPGPPVARPVYAPALVAFVGVALALEANRGPGVAWFPLAPREVYRPSYRASPRYVTNVNVTNTVINRTEINKVVNVTNITNVTNVNYANRRVPGAVTAVPAQVFVHAQPVRQSAVPLNRRQLAAAPVVSRLALAPQADSRGGGQRAHGAPPPALLARPVVAHTAPKLPPALKVAPVRGAPRPEAEALAAVAPQVKVLHALDSRKPLTAPPPPRAMAAGGPAHAPPAAVTPPGALASGIARPRGPVAAAPPLGAMGGVAPPTQSAGAQLPHGATARPPQQVAALQSRPQPQQVEPAPRPQPPQHAVPLPPPRGDAERLREQAARVDTAHAPPAVRGEVPHPMQPAAGRQEPAHPQALARQDASRPQTAAPQEPPRQQVARPEPQRQAARPESAPQQQIARPEPPRQQLARQEVPRPQPVQRPEPPRPQAQPPREPPRQLAMAKPPEPPHRPSPPPEVHRAPQPAPQPHAPAARPPEHQQPADKDKHKDKDKDKHEG